MIHTARSTHAEAVAAGDKVLNGTAFASRIPIHDDDPFTVIALHDIDVPVLAVSGN